MSYVILYVVTFIVFLGIDFLGLGVVVKPVFEKHIPDLLRDSPRLVPAFFFYAFYVAGLLWFVSIPALEADKSLLWVAASAAIIAGIGFGTYEFTSLAIVKGWSWQMVAVDLLWGLAMTATAAVVGVAVTRAVVT